MYITLTWFSAKVYTWCKKKKKFNKHACSLSLLQKGHIPFNKNINKKVSIDSKNHTRRSDITLWSKITDIVFIDQEIESTSQLNSGGQELPNI